MSFTQKEKDDMTNREKFLSVINSLPNAEMPVVHFGYWDETVEKWKAEGYAKAEDSWGDISSKLGFDFGYGECFAGSTALFPAFDVKTVKEFPDGSRHVLNHEGVIELQKPGVVSIPSEIGHTLTDRASWEKHYLPRLQFSEDRLDLSWLQGYASADQPLGLYAGSFYGTIRNWFGIVGLSYIALDDEELYDEVIRTVGDLAYSVVGLALEKAASLGITFDYLHFWEDICFNTGPLVNPLVFAEKTGPYYKKTTDLGRRYGVKIFSLDCDGKIDELLPVWLDNGVNTMFPIEVGTWGASIAPWRERYGSGVLGVGGMDKRVFAHGRSAVDAEIERLKPLAALGGFIPCPDHRIPPDAEWDTVRYYCEKMREAFCV
jgi:uroporphyrinogen decarboxylase